MRIISGKYKGKRLIAPKKLPVRPTADMQKEALFNILRNNYDFINLRVLDLFSGTGNIAYEFASRGTDDITAVDAHHACIKFIAETSKDLEFSIACFKSDVFKYLKKTEQKFDVIFADPPYQMPLANFERIPELVFERDLLTEEGILIIEHASQTDLALLPFFKEKRKYGSSVFSFFAK